MRQYAKTIKSIRSAREGKKANDAILQSAVTPYKKYHPRLALRGALHYEVFGELLTPNQCQDIDLDWYEEIAIAQADLLFEAGE